MQTINPNNEHEDSKTESFSTLNERVSQKPPSLSMSVSSVTCTNQSL